MCLLGYFKVSRTHAIPIHPSTTDSVVMSDGLSFGMGTFMRFQRPSFVNMERKTKKNPIYPQNDNIRYAIIPRQPSISMIEVTLILKVNPTMSPMIASIERSLRVLVCHFHT